MKRKYADVAGVRLVVSERVPTVSCQHSAAAAGFARPFFEGAAVEHFGAIFLDAALNARAFCIITTGILNCSLVHPREVFQRAVLVPAAGVILVHNHPSGSLEASAEDLKITRQLVEAGKLMGIPIHDHIILTDKGYTSFAERGLL